VVPALTSPAAFDPALVADLDEPVRRFFSHALREGAALAPGVRLAMRGQIRLGAWLPFRATAENRRDAFSWRARVGAGPVAVLTADDGFGDGAGHMDVRLLGRLPVLGAGGPDTARSAAGRAAAEAALFAPMTLLPGSGATWRAEDDTHVVARWDVGPERPEVHLCLDAEGAVRTVWCPRWRDAGRGYEPFGGAVHAQRRFGDVVVPSRFTVGWGFGTPRHAPFFRAELTDLAPLPAEPAR
jgi:hypothetical protein